MWVRTQKNLIIIISNKNHFSPHKNTLIKNKILKINLMQFLIPIISKYLYGLLLSMNIVDELEDIIFRMSIPSQISIRQGHVHFTLNWHLGVCYFKVNLSHGPMIKYHKNQQEMNGHPSHNRGKHFKKLALSSCLLP